MIKFTERTLSILKNFQNINPSMVFKPGNVIDTKSITRKIKAIATVEHEFPREFGIFELSKFFSALSLFTEPEIVLEKHFLIIQDGNRSLHYVIADPRDVMPPDASPFNALPSVETAFLLPSKTIKNVIKAAAVMEQPNVIIKGDGTSIKIATGNIEKPTNEGYREDVGEFFGGDAPFQINLHVDNLKLYPGDYEVSINYEMKIVQFNGKDVNYFIAAEANSTVPKCL